MGRVSAAPPQFTATEPLAARHDVSRFTNGVHSSLDQWLRERARLSEAFSAQTFVVCSTEEPDRVVGYFSISAAVEQRNALPSAKLRHGMPEQVPLLLIGRLAVDAEWRIPDTVEPLPFHCFAPAPDSPKQFVTCLGHSA